MLTSTLAVRDVTGLDAGCRHLVQNPVSATTASDKGPILEFPQAHDRGSMTGAPESETDNFVRPIRAIRVCQSDYV